MAATIYGILGLPDAQRTIQSIGQVVIYDAIQQLLARHNADLNSVLGTFVGSTTSTPEETYAAGGGGMMQESDRLTRPAAVKAGQRYTVGYPLRDARDQIAGDDVTYAYMSLADLQVQVQNIFMRHINWTRFNVLKSFLNNANYTFEDETLSQRLIAVKRFANLDGTIYPPTIQMTLDGADDQHYLVAGYLSSAISNANNPFVPIRNEIREHFGDGNVVVFINSAQQAVVEALTNFIEYTDPMIAQPVDQPRIVGRAPSDVPGTITGRINNCWVSVWDFVPPDYMVATDLDADPPLRKRVDAVPVAGSGNLALIARQQEFPLEEAFWRCRQGFGVANRLNGVVMQFKASGNYDIPAGYAL